MPAISVDEAARALQVTDRLIRELPEVEQVYGNAGRAQTATDPAPLSMFETVIALKPQDQWPDGESIEQLLGKLDRQVQLPGLTNGWGYPIRTRIDMLASGIRTPLGLKVSGPDQEIVLGLAQRAESALRGVPGTRNAFAERIGGGRYLDIDLDRRSAAQRGVTMADVQRVVQGAIGGENITSVVSGRERYSVNLRFPRAWRDSPQSIAEIPIVTERGDNVRLGDVAHLALRDGASEIKSENAQLVAYVYLNLDSTDLGGYVRAADRALAQIALPPGYTMSWSGQYEQMQHARALELAHSRDGRACRVAPVHSLSQLGTGWTRIALPAVFLRRWGVAGLRVGLSAFRRRRRRISRIGRGRHGIWRRYAAVPGPRAGASAEALRGRAARPLCPPSRPDPRRILTRASQGHDRRRDRWRLATGHGRRGAG